MNRMHQHLTFIGILALALVFVAAVPAVASDVKGKIVNIEADDHLFDVVTNEGNVMNFRALVTVEIFINNEPRTMWDLKAGDAVTVTYDVEGNTFIATRIVCTRE